MLVKRPAGGPPGLGQRIEIDTAAAASKVALTEMIAGNG
jgi:hypothetical protein